MPPVHAYNYDYNGKVYVRKMLLLMYVNSFLFDKNF